MNQTVASLVHLALLIQEEMPLQRFAEREGAAAMNAARVGIEFDID